MSNFIDFLKHQAYDNLDITGHEVDIHGWCSHEFSSVVKRSIAKLDRNAPVVIVEVGTWKGLSALNMGKLMKNEGFTNFNIICIDTWLGAPEFWTSGFNDTTRGVSLKFNNGYPSVFYTFTKNVKALGLEDCIAPLPLSSTQAADVLKYYNIQPDLIYIDASHEFLPVLNDIESFYPLLKSAHVMLGDDYVNGWDGVIQAVNTFTNKNKLDLKVDHVVWSFTKP